jgi:ABC-type polysaccharide/polyol phosphate export permease
VGFEIVTKLSDTHEHCITYLFHFGVIFFGSSQCFRDEVNWDLLGYFFLFFIVSFTCTELNSLLCVMERRI